MLLTIKILGFSLNAIGLTNITDYCEACKYCFLGMLNRRQLSLNFLKTSSNFDRYSGAIFKIYPSHQML